MGWSEIQISQNPTTWRPQRSLAPRRLPRPIHRPNTASHIRIGNHFSRERTHREPIAAEDGPRLSRFNLSIGPDAQYRRPMRPTQTIGHIPETAVGLFAVFLNSGPSETHPLYRLRVPLVPAAINTLWTSPRQQALARGRIF